MKKRWKPMLWAALIALAIVAIPLYNYNQSQAGIDNILTASENIDYFEISQYAIPYLGDNSGVGQILSLSPMSEYMVDGFKLQTEQEPYSLEVEYQLPKDKVYTQYEIELMEKITAINTFALIDNLGEMQIHARYFNKEGQNPGVGFAFDRESVDKMAGRPVSELKGDPDSWKKIVSENIK